MAILRLYIYSRPNHSDPSCEKVTFTDRGEDDGFVKDVWNTIRRCYAEHCRNLCGIVLHNIQPTREALAALQAKYDAVHKEVRRLTMFCSSKKLSEGELFYVFDADKAQWSDRRVSMDVLQYTPLRAPIGFVHNKLFDKYLIFEHEFDVYGYGFDGIKVEVGEKDKSKRKCRFCGCTDPKKFKDEAHAIQDSLGNKLLVCLEECDDCNHTLNAVEDNFLHLMDVRRALFGISRKEGFACPHLVGENFALMPDGNGKPVLYLKSERLKEEGFVPIKPFTYRLKLKANITNEGIYKALTKMVIDLIPTEELPHFENTVRWLKSKGLWMPDILPDILVGYLDSKKFYKQPALDIFIKKQGGPYCTAVLWICDLAYIFVVPFVDKDAGQYKYNSSLAQHWKKFLVQLPFIRMIMPQDSFEWRNTMPWVDREINPNEQNVRILPESDAVFQDKTLRTPTREEETFPPFTRSKIEEKKVNVRFKNLHYGKRVTDAELKDATITFDYILFDLDAKHKQVTFGISYIVRDTTNKTDFFKLSAKVIFSLGEYSKHIRQIYGKKGVLQSFSIDVKLRDYLFEQALKAIDVKASSKLEKAYFRHCLASKFLDQKDRLLKYSYYRLFIGNELYVIRDEKVHPIGCE